MERLCIASFLKHGHEVHLYVYQDTEGIPPGTVVRDGREILPESRIFMYREYATYAGFANFFRYKLLLEKGGCSGNSNGFKQRVSASTNHPPFSSSSL